MATILFPVLNWGLGHASRSSHVIRYLLEKGHRVIPASDGTAHMYLQQRFPSLKVHRLPALTIRYPYHNAILNTGLQSMHLLQSFIRDKEAMRQLVREAKADIVLSDHRLAAAIPGCFNIILMHQINIPLSWGLAMPANAITRYFLVKYHEIWIPDTPERLLSGQLSRIKSSKVRFIGPLSHFAGMAPIPSQDKAHWDVLVILSGPEPQRTYFEEALMHHLQGSGLKTLIVQGLPDKNQPSTLRQCRDNIHCIPFLSPGQLLPLILESRYLIARSGYSTIMDLITLGRTALLVPTPGQPEQNYLAMHLLKNGRFVFQKQSELNIQMAFRQLDRIEEGITLDKGSYLLQRAIEHLPAG